MAPKKKNAPRKELTADDMRRLGMSEEDITRILAERGKSADERRQETETAEARRKEQEQRHRRQKELERHKEELERDEGGPRAEMRGDEEAAWAILLENLTAEKKRRTREIAEKEAQQRTAEARRRREAEFVAYQETLGHLTPEEREAFVAAQIKAEQERLETELQEEERQRERQERRLAREKARKAMQRRSKQDGGDGGDEVQLDNIDQMAEAIISKYD